MTTHQNKDIDIHDEVNYDPTVWVPRAESHGTKSLMKVFWILLALTIVDIILYFLIPKDMALVRISTFIILGIVKAAFIVFEFMHMKYEKKMLQKIIIYPMLLVIYLILLALTEAGYMNANYWQNL